MASSSQPLKSSPGPESACPLAKEIAQRFLKSIMKHVGALSGQNPDDEEDDIIPSSSGPRTE